MVSSSSSSAADGLRRRAAKGKGSGNGFAAVAKQSVVAHRAQDVLLKRRSSWQQAADHVASRRIYSILAGIVLGVLGVVTLQVYYFEQPLPDLLPPESVRSARAHLMSATMKTS